MTRGGRAAAVVAAFVVLLAGGVAFAAYRRAHSGPYDPYRSRHAELGLRASWPVRGDRARDRSWMRANVYCCSDYRHQRVLFASSLDGHPVVLTESAGKDGARSLVVPGARYDYVDFDGDQVSWIGPSDMGRPLVVLAEPQATATYSTTGPAGPFQPMPMTDGAGMVRLGPVNPVNVVIRVREGIRRVYEGTVSAYWTPDIGSVSEAPPKLVPLTPAVAAIAGDSADDVAVRYCVTEAVRLLPDHVARALPDPVEGHGSLDPELERIRARLAPLRGRPEAQVAAALRAPANAAFARERCAAYARVMAG